MAVSVSMRNAQSTARSPTDIHWATWTRVAPSPKPTRMKATQDRAAATKSSPVVMISLTRAPSTRPKSPATRKPTSGRKTIAWYIAFTSPFRRASNPLPHDSDQKPGSHFSGSCSAPHHVDVLNRDGAAVAEEDHQNGEADGCL